jgi:hypothetical protein
LGGPFSGIEERMSAKTIFTAALVMAVLGFGTVRGQTTTPSYSGSNESNNNNNNDANDEGHKPGQVSEGPHTLSNYITYQRPDCCGPIGGDGPIQLELYSRAGVSVPIGNTSFTKALQNGWMIEGGGRSLFFNPAMDAAWTIDLGLSNTWNHGEHPEIQFPLNNIIVPFAASATAFPPQASFAIGNFVPHATPTITTVTPTSGPSAGTAIPVFTAPGVSIHFLNRTFVNLGFGREYYLLGSAHDCGTRWRVGADVGGRWGSAKLGLNEIRHRTGVLEGVFASVHTDLEWPCCSVVFVAGLRAEWSYTFSEILQEQNNADVQEINLMVTAGVRF